MSPSSIAQVCDTTKQKVLEILKSIFGALIDLAKKGEWLSIDVRIGYLNIDKDKKLYFTNTKDQAILK